MFPLIHADISALGQDSSRVSIGVEDAYAMQVMGRAGFLKDALVARLFLDAKLMEIGAGTSEIRRMLVGREMMGAMG